MATWLVFVHAPNYKDKKYAEKALARMQVNLSPGVDVYVIFFGPTVTSPVTFRYYTREKALLLETRENKGIDAVVGNLQHFSTILVQKRTPIDAICFWMHGASIGGGPWKGWKRPFIQINDAVRLLIEPFGAPLVCFDACYQGGMSCLFELPAFVKVVVASPAFHPFCSVLWTRAFGALQKGLDGKPLLEYAHSINCEWYDLTKASFRCMLVFDMEFIPLIAAQVKEHFYLLRFDKKSQIDKEDTNLHDLYAAARDVPPLMDSINKSIHASCIKCIKSCNKRVRGMSIEGHMPRKWIPAFLSTKWAAFMGSRYVKNM